MIVPSQECQKTTETREYNQGLPSPTFNLKLHQSQDHPLYIHISAPEIQKCNFGNLEPYSQNQQVLNSCNYANGQIYFLREEYAQISQFQDEAQTFTNQRDIFDQIQDLNFDSLNHSIYEENQIENQTNFPTEIFAFNLSLNQEEKTDYQIKHIQTERVNNKSYSKNKESRSLQRKNGSKRNIDSSLTDLNNFFEQNAQPAFKRKQNPENKRKYQPFTTFLKQTNILSQILPSNCNNQHSLREKSIVSGFQQSEKSIFSEKLSNHGGNIGQKQKLFKKIDKLLHIKNNSKTVNLLQKKPFLKQQCIGNKNQIKFRSTFLGKQNLKTSSDAHSIKFQANIQVDNYKKTKDRIEHAKIFKRTSLNNEFLRGRQRISRLGKDFIQNQHKQLQISEIRSVQTIKIKQETAFNHIQLSSSLLIRLSHHLSPQIYQSFIDLNKLDTSLSNELIKLSTNRYESSDFRFQNQKILSEKLEGLQKQERYLSEMKDQFKHQIKQTDSWLKLLSKPTNRPQNTVGNDTKGKFLDLQCNSNSLIEIINEKRNEIKQNFDLWKQIDLYQS